MAPGVVPQGFALLDLMRLARRAPGGMEALFPGVAAALLKEDRED